MDGAWAGEQGGECGYEFRQGLQEGEQARSMVAALNSAMLPFGGFEW